MLTFKLFTMETQLFTKDKQAKRDESHGYKKEEGGCGHNGPQIQLKQVQVKKTNGNRNGNGRLHLYLIIIKNKKK